MSDSNDDLLTFVDEDLPPPGSSRECWRVLLVDDEPDVHAATRLALKGLQIEGREVAFEHAYSAAEARRMLGADDGFAVAIIDVVMESDDAGLQLVRHIREQLRNRALRIILRTGQPGYAPEIDTIRLYDINDYKTKAELTRVRLFTSVTIAIRSYAQIQQLEAGRHGLELILAATTELGKPAGMNKFAAGVVTQLCALLGVGEEGLVCAAMGEADRPPFVLAAAGSFTTWIGVALSEIPEPRVREGLERTLRSQRHSFDDGACLFFSNSRQQALAAFVDVRRPLSGMERGLLEVFCSNISVAFENVQLYLIINDLAYADALVELPNRNAFIASIAAREAEQDTVALVDLDGFSDINSILDDSFGDAVLQVVARRLRECFPASTRVARLGGDLFGLHGPAADITPVNIGAVFATPFVCQSGEPLRLSATSGLVRIDDAAQPAVEILRNAGAALKQAKSFQRGKALYFEPVIAEAARDRMHMLSRLRESFSADRLFLHYQPLVDLRDGRIVGAESLLRWRTEDGTFIPPDRFIPLAEQSGLMVAIGEWVMRTALKWRAGLKGTVDERFRVAINVSHVQFSEPDFVAGVLRMLAEAGVAGQQVEIELTESVAAENTSRIVDKLGELRAQGISVAMDDFGTGYSSLSILQRLRLDRLKIDRSFISGGNHTLEHLGITRTIIKVAAQLQLRTLAEGIESEEQRQALLDAGCEEGQGYLFARPLAEADFRRLLADAVDGRIRHR